MSYSISEIKVAAYNYTILPDMTTFESDLFTGLAYCYEWYRMHPEDRAACESLMNHYIKFFEQHQLREIKPKRNQQPNLNQP